MRTDILDATPSSLTRQLDNNPDRPRRHSRSHYTGGAHSILKDGSARFISDSISQVVWRSLGTRAGGEVVGEF